MMRPPNQATSCLCVIALLLGVSVCGRAAEPVPRIPTLFIIGDSTVKNSTKGQCGWGEKIDSFFDPGKIKITNHAIGGRSSRTFQTEGRWARVLSELKPGDFVVMQFGHNDGGPVNDNSRARGSLRGIGEQTQEIDNLLTKKPEVVHTYGWYMRKYVADTKSSNATPIVLSLVPRKIWRNNRIARATNDYGSWAAASARSADAAFVDLNEIVSQRYETLGPEQVNDLFGDDHTHTNPAGAELNAECVIAGLKAVQDAPFNPFLSQKGIAVPAFKSEETKSTK